MAVLRIDKNQFQTEVLDEKGVVFIDFYADWCGPCQMVSPIVEELSEELTEVKFVKINVDENQELASQYSIFSIPTLMIFKNGQVVNQIVGARGKEALRQEINKVLEK